MKTYKHWLLIKGISRPESTRKQWNNVKEFIDKYPESKVTVYNREYGNIFDKLLCLETSQCYNDLDLDCNSFFDGSLNRLDRKPPDLIETKSFDFMHQVYSCEPV